MIKSVWKFKQNMAKSHKTCMAQAEIIDTFGMYQQSSITLSLGVANKILGQSKYCNGEHARIYSRKNIRTKYITHHNLNIVS